MLDSFNCCGDKLSDQSVFSAFLSVVGKLRRGAKPEGKVSGMGTLALLASSTGYMVCSPKQCSKALVSHVPPLFLA
jgi:hypothetical protein